MDFLFGREVFTCIHHSSNKLIGVLIIVSVVVRLLLMLRLNFTCGILDYSGVPPPLYAYMYLSLHLSLSLSLSPMLSVAERLADLAIEVFDHHNIYHGPGCLFQCHFLTYYGKLCLPSTYNSRDKTETTAAHVCRHSYIRRST